MNASPFFEAGFSLCKNITGAGGTLVVTNQSALVNVGQAHPTSDNAMAHSQATLDLSGLANFTAAVSRLLVGVDISIKGCSGVLNLARTNTVSLAGAAPQLDVGDNSQAGGAPTIPSILLLGQTNAFYADSVVVGRGKTDNTGALMQFNSTFSSPTAYFRGTNGDSSRVGTWIIGDGYGSRTYYAYGTCDFSLGTVNMLVDTMYVGRGASTAYGAGANNPGTGTLTFSAGNVDVNTLVVGYSLTAAGTGTVNANGGTLVVNTNLVLANGATAAGTLNISSATVTANNGIIAGGGTATITLNGGTLNATNSTATIGTDAAPVTTLASTNSTLKLAARNLTPAVTVSTLECGGSANTLSFSSVPVITALPARFTVIQYAASSGNLGSFTLGTMPAASPAYAGYISNNTANASLDLVITNGPVTAPLIWHGNINGDWDTTTANWKTNGVSTTYQQGYLIVRFDDTLTGTTNVNLTTTLTRGSLTVDNSVKDYVFSGTGKISGATGLTKSGTRSLTLTQSGGDDFTGGVTVAGGTLRIGNGGTSGNLAPGQVSVGTGTALIFSRSDNIAVASVVSGLGTLFQQGASILTLNGSNTAFAGGIVVASGTLQPGNPAALGTVAASVTVSNGATLDVNGQKFNNAQPITASGAGVNGNGAIVNASTNSPNQVLRVVTLTGNTTFGGSSDWDIRASANAASDASLSTGGNDFRLTKVGTNTVTLFGAQVDGSLGDIEVQSGTLSFERNTTSMGNPNKTVTVFTNAILQLQNASNVWSKVVVLKDGATLRAINLNEFAGPVTLESGTGTFLAGTGAQLTVNNIVGGAGGLTKTGSGTVSLKSANTYGGGTVVSGGTLALYGGGFDGSIASSTNININSGATLDVSGRSDARLTLASGQTLLGGVGTNGPGTINGILLAGVGATVAPGTGTTNVGTLSVTSNMTLQGATVMKISAADGNDEIDAAGITYGGTLVVTNFSGAVTNGQSFQLFVATNGYNLNFSSVTLPSAPGLAWTNTLTTNGRITAGVVGSSPPPQPRITSVSLSGTNLVISGTNGTAGQQFQVLTSTNVALALTNWTAIATNTFGGGNFSVTNIVNPLAPRNFYILRLPWP